MKKVRPPSNKNEFIVKKEKKLMRDSQIVFIERCKLSKTGKSAYM